MKFFVTLTLAVLMLGLGMRSVATADDLLVNRGFETPTVEKGATGPDDPGGWILFSSLSESEKIGVSAVQSRGGKQSVHFATQATPESYQGVFQSTLVAADTSYTFTVYARNNSANPLKGTARGQISIEWKNADEEEIDRVWGPDWGESLSSAQWTKFEMTAKAPPKSARAHFVITQFDGQEPGSSGGFYADDASATPAR